MRCAVVAADEGSFRRAADLLLVRQSTLSRGIRQLEQLLKISIFHRSSSGVTATPSGRGFLLHARSILEDIDSLIVTAHRSSRGEAGRLSIGFQTSLSAGNLRATLLEFRQRVPSVELGLVEMSRTRLMTALRSGTMDVVIVTGEATQREDGTLPLWSERILLALQEGHPQADRETIYWTDLRDETILLSQCDQGREFEDILISKLVPSEDRPRIERRDVCRDTMKDLVSLGFGVGLVTESDVGSSVSGLVYRELRDGTGPSRIGYSAHWRAENDNPALANFLALLRERYPSPAV
ncbi:MAG: LysR substrate-binding domain-containing protein [bacterium]|nr:LysR substrate-binding domain-containing protein [bacterium]